MTKKKADYEVGSRKRAISRASAKLGTGKVRVNSIPLDIFGTETQRLMIAEPLLIAGEHAKKYDFNIIAKGGGPLGQAAAIRQSIAKILAKHDKALRKKFLDYDRSLLIADVRRTEPHKPSCSKRGPRRHKQRSKR
ncbi:MAG: 30S ribosomal protein S9 [Candidatus Aenigmarchaeota archaeon]|nr:30S ribosomal protein S9 [Candidatus Aenigmarchaeota archaeon]